MKASTKEDLANQFGLKLYADDGVAIKKGHGVPLHRHTTTLVVGRSIFRLIRLPNPFLVFDRLYQALPLSDDRIQGLNCLIGTF